jgi:hypothetical protein
VTSALTPSPVPDRDRLASRNSPVPRISSTVRTSRGGSATSPATRSTLASTLEAASASGSRRRRPSRYRLGERSGHQITVTAVGVEQSDRSPMTMAGRNLLPLSHGYLGDLARTPALRGFRASAAGSGVAAGSGAANAPLAAPSGFRGRRDKMPVRQRMQGPVGQRPDGLCATAPRLQQSCRLGYRSGGRAQCDRGRYSARRFFQSRANSMRS